MKYIDCSIALTAAFALQFSVACAKHGNAHLSALERLHNHHRTPHVSKAEEGHGIELRTVEAEKRTGKCQFPTDAGLVAVTPNDANGGWAMSPDQCCEPGNYCPYACPPGQVMAQWDPDAKSYTYPQSMNGGLYCDKSGAIQKPFPNKPYCVDGTGNIGCKNKAKGNVAFCQTVLPGNEAMLIPTDIEEWAQLAVPGPDYWAGTSAHFYINPPGISTEEACVWGSSSNPWGNWSPYVAGANTANTGETYIKLAWNPIYLEPATPFRDKMPTWGVEIVCDGHCNGLPCAIDPSKHKVNEIDGASTDGVGGANFCVVTVPKGTDANFVVFEGGMNVPATGSEGSQPALQKPSSPGPAYSHVAPSAPPPQPSSSSYSSSPSSFPNPAPTSTPTPTPTPTPMPSLYPISSSAHELSSSSSPPPLTSSPVGTPSTFAPPVLSGTSANSTTNTSPSTEPSIALTRTALSLAYSKYQQKPTSLPAPSFSYRPHVFIENSTATASISSNNGQSSAEPSAPGNATLHNAYVGPPAGISGGSFNVQVTFTGFGVTALIAIAALVL